MKKLVPALLAFAMAALLAACSSQPGGTQTDAPKTDTLLQSYYLNEDAPAYSYLQNNSIQKFFAMWLDEYMGEQTDAQWDYTSLAPVQLLNHDFDSIADPDTELYTCTFTTASGATGYIIVAYYEDGPSIQKWSLHATPPYQYDLRANLDAIVAALAKTDIDLPTATAARAEWIDTAKNRGDRIILFTDGKGDRYICYLGDDDFTVEKQ